MSNWLSNLLSGVFYTLGILKLEVKQAGSQKLINGCELWWYMMQMSVNEKINWLNHFVQHVIRVEEFWKIRW